MLIVVIAAHLIVQARTPIYHFDDRMYRASRAAYWIQHRSLLPWDAANERQVSFAFGSEILFFWPLLMTRSEVLARTLYGLSVPLCAAGFYSVVRAGRAGVVAGLAGALALLVTPTIMRAAAGLSPELWMTVFGLGAAFFSLRARARRGRRGVDLFLAGVFAALTAGVRLTGMALAVTALALPWLIGMRGRWRGATRVALGIAASLLLGGAAICIGTNLVRHGHPIGSTGLREHMPEVSARQVRTHLARFALSLVDLPITPAPLRRNLRHDGQWLLHVLDADVPLPREEPPSTWPGPYEYNPGRTASQFSLGGILWVPALIAAVTMAVFDLTRRRRRTLLPRRLRPAALVAVLALPLTLGVVLLVRWMYAVDRFWVTAYALGFVVVLLLDARSATRSRVSAVIALILVGVMVFPALRDLSHAAVGPVTPSAAYVDEPFDDALKHIPQGSRILIVGSADAREYPLFDPRHGLANRVIPWGKSQFDPQRMAHLIESEGVTHVIVEDDQVIAVHWNPPVPSAEMVRWLQARPDLREIPINPPRMRLFTRDAAATATTSGYNAWR